jgi:RNA polymerase sigma-70 factor (ECF subfamily)
MDDDIQELLGGKRYRESFDLMVTRYQHKVFRLAFSYMRDASQAEDTTQEIFLRLWRALPGFTGAASLSTWLYTIARNTCLNQTRSRSYRQTLSMDVPAIRAAAEARRDKQEVTGTGIDVRSLIEDLPQPGRQVLLLFYTEDKSYEEVSAMLNMPLGTVKSHLHRCKKLLGEALVPKLEEKEPRR